ncbi:MAG: ABC transporter substrate-binding protein [Anaerolineae bacterium]
MRVPVRLLLILTIFAVALAGCTAATPSPTATPQPANTLVPATVVPTQPPPTATSLPATATSPAATPTASEPIVHTMAGDDWGYPSPFAFYSRGPGYLRMSYLFDTLVWKDRKGYVPWLAEKWSLAEDGMTWTFTLRTGVKWHDGTPLTAEDVVFTFAYFKDKAAQGMVKWGWPVDKVASATVAEGGRAVVIRMAKPTAGLMTDLFGSLPIIPKHIWEGVADPVQKLDADAVIGSSLFKLREYSKEEGRYVYEANPDFFLGKPAIDRLVFIQVKDPALALLAGQIDEAGFSGKGIASVRELRTKPEFQVLEGPSDWTLKLYINTNRAPLDRRDVRQALAHAINRQDIVDKAQMGGAIVASLGILSPGSYWHNPNLPAYAYDPAKAQQLLNSAGVGSFSVTLLTTESYAREAEMISTYLQAVGIQVTVKTGDRNTVDQLLREGNFDLLITGHGGTANPDQDNPSVPAAWNSEEYSAIYQELVGTVQDPQRRELSWRLQEITARELPVLCLWHPLMWEVYRPGRVEPFFTPEGVDGGIPSANNKLMFMPAP